MTATARFALAGLTLDAESDDPADPRWLDEFLHPALAPQAPLTSATNNTAPDWRVRLEVDPERYRQWLAVGSRGGERIAFLLDSGVSRLPLWHHDGPGTLLHDPQLEAFYQIQSGPTGTQRDR